MDTLDYCSPYLCKYRSWFGEQGGSQVLIECPACARLFWNEYLETWPGSTMGVTSMPGDPLHPGHISIINHASQLCTMLFIVVNGDEFLKHKKGAAFMPLKARCQIIGNLRPQNIFVVPFEPSNPDDTTVNEALQILRPNKFFKGGDRKDAASIPEWETCKEFGIELLTNIGDTKTWSSSDFLRNWDERKKNG